MGTLKEQRDRKWIYVKTKGRQAMDWSKEEAFALWPKTRKS